MLTGKDVYEAARPNIVKHGFEDLAWEDFVPEAQEFYIELAARLNDAHIAPLQGKVKELEGRHCSVVHDCDIAEQQLNELEQREEALVALLRDYMEFSKYATPLLKRGRLEWEAESEALAQRAQALLTEKEQ